MLNSTEHEIYPAHKFKMPTFVGILKFISRIYTIFESLKARPIFIFAFQFFMSSCCFLGPPGVLGIWGKWLYMFMELGSTCNYFQGFGGQAHSFGDLRSHAKKVKKNLTLKENPSFHLIFWKKSSASRPPSPLENLNVFSFVYTCLSGLVVPTDMANTFYICGNLSLKLLIFRLIITYFGTLWMRQISTFKETKSAIMNIFQKISFSF